ncbi:WD40/YVTN/BNR-like repeat-containing protein [Chloroflexota bacterium]
MKKKITKIMGIGLALVLASSLLFMVLPASAGTLSWGSEDLPAEDNYVLLSDSDVVDIAVGASGDVIYTCNGTENIFRSSNGGESWSKITVLSGSVMPDADLITVAPDDENYIAVCATDNSTVYISSDAGANWDSLGAPGAYTTTGLAISPEKSGKYTIAISLNDGGNGEVWYYEIGAVGATWTDASAITSGGYTTSTHAGAVAFSPNFPSDQVMVAVTANATDIFLQIFSFNQDLWNSTAGAFDGYPVSIIEESSDAVVDGLDSASIAMAPDYLGSDDSMRVCFVGITTTGTASGDDADGIFRLEDDDVEALKEDKNIHSVDFDGSRLVAGRYDAIDIYRSSDPLASSPSVSGSTSSKEPGGDDKVVAAFAGADVVVGTSGVESCFSVSADDGKTFNDISLIDTTLTILCDVAVNEDGSKIYMLSANGTGAAGTVALSVWRYESRWERIYSNQSRDDDYILRVATGDDDVIYLADTGSSAKTIYYTSDGGMTKWHTRTSRYDITDLAVEADGDVAYVMTDNGYVSKSTNTGFTWDSKVSSKLQAGSSMLVSLGEDLLLGGSSDGYVSYSTNGNSSWTLIDDDIGGAVQVVATGLADGDFLIAASDTANDYIYNLELGEDDEWNAITADDYIADGFKVYGVALAEGVFYAVGANSTGNISQLYRTLSPTSGDPTWSTVNSAGEQFDSTPSALRVSVDAGVTKLWAINSDAMTLFSFKDTLAINGPSLTAPADGFKVTVNPVTGRANQLIFSWKSLSDNIDEWDFVIATDADFDEAVLDEPVVAAADEGDTVSQVVGPYVSTAFGIDFMPNTTYYWKVRVDAAGPIRSQWSEVRSFNTGDLQVFEPVVINQPPAPIISVPPAPEITIEVPEIVMPAYPAPAPAPEIVIPPAPEPTAPIPAYALWAIIIIGAVLVIAVIILIMRTRRPV